jgi:hypothetical protein
MKRLAVCIRGDFRSWEHTKVKFFQSYEDGEYDIVDYFICTYSMIGHSYRTINIGTTDGQIKGNRPHPHVVLYKTTLPIERIKNDFKNKNLVEFEIVDDSLREQSTSNQYYLMYRCNLLKRLYEIKNNFTYDCVVSTRTDVIVKNNKSRVNHDTRWINGGRSYFWTNTGHKVDFCQDLQFVGTSLAIDTLNQFYHVFNTKFDEYLCVHSSLAKYINNSEIGYTYPPDLISVYRKDGINHMPFQDEQDIHNITKINNTWHEEHIKNRHIPVVKNHAIIKENYKDNKLEYKFELTSVLSSEVTHLLQTLSFISKFSKTVLFNRILNNSDRINNYYFFDRIKELYSTHNIVCETNYSLDETALLLSILDITPYVSKIIFGKYQESEMMSEIDLANEIIDILDEIEIKLSDPAILNNQAIVIDLTMKNFEISNINNHEKFAQVEFLKSGKISKIITNCYTDVYNIFAHITLYQNDESFKIFISQGDSNRIEYFLNDEGGFRHINVETIKK